MPPMFCTHLPTSSPSMAASVTPATVVVTIASEIRRFSGSHAADGPMRYAISVGTAYRIAAVTAMA